MIVSPLPYLHGFGTRNENIWLSAGVPESRLCRTRQTHSDIVRVVHEPGESLEPCDALVTNVPKLALCLYTADCVPVLLCDVGNGVYGAVHAGWRGTVNGIVSKTVAKMQELGADPGQIHAAIGPALGSCCFETDEDVPLALTDALGEVVRPLLTKKGTKWHVDCKECNAMRLRLSGVDKIWISEDCTGCRLDLFHSYRKEKTGARQFSMIYGGVTADG